MLTAKIVACFPTSEIVMDIGVLTLAEVRETMSAIELYAEGGEYLKAQEALEPLLRKTIVLRKSACHVPLSRGQTNLVRLMALEDTFAEYYATLQGAIEYIATRGAKELS